MESRNLMVPNIVPNTELAPCEAQFVNFVPPVAPAPISGERTSLMEYWHVVLKRKWVIAACVLTFTTLATMASFRMLPLYEGRSRIAINRESSDLLGFKEMGSATTDEDQWDYNVALDTQVTVLQSDNLALQVIKQLQLYKHPYFAGKKVVENPGAQNAMQLDPVLEANVLRVFHSRLGIAKVPRTRVVEISFLSPDPRLSADIVNAVVNAFIEQNFKTKYESTMQTSNWLSKQLVDLQMNVETSQEKLVRYQRDNNILGLDEKQNIVTSKLNELNTQLTTAQADRMQKEAAYALTQSGNLELIPGVSDNRVIQKLKEQEADLKNQYAQASTQFGPQFPKLVELKNQINQVDAGINSEVSKIAGRIKNEYTAAKAREALLAAALDKQKQEANKLNESSIQYNILKRDVETNRQLYEGLLQRLKEAGVSAGLKSGNIRLVDVARPPLHPAKPNIPLNVAVALFGSLICGTVLAFVAETLDNTIRNPDDVQLVSGLPSLAMIPLDRPAQARRQQLTAEAEPANNIQAITFFRPKSEVSESYRALRTSVLLSSSGAPPRTILITSGLPQEGKTTTSINTAVVMAQRGGKVLLIDADMRRPSVHRHFDLRMKSGLSEVLSGTAKVRDAVVTLPQIPNLCILPAGPPPPYPAELLGSKAMKELLAECAQEFDHIIIDTPPVLTVTDAVLLSPHMDAVMVVTRAGNTTRHALRRTRDVLRQVNARVVGVVVNAVDLHSNSHYYYGHYYGSKYGGYYSEEGSRTS